MKLQTKCTLVILGLFIIEILPIPVTSLYSLYAIRKRPLWIPRVTHQLYADATIPPAKIAQHSQELSDIQNPMAVRKNCTIGLSIMFVFDLLIPIVIPTALYVVQKRPQWFKRLI